MKKSKFTESLDCLWGTFGTNTVSERNLLPEEEQVRGGLCH